MLTVLKTSQAQIDPRHSGRLELARWIANRDNPLTARVMVNRVWEHLLGQGSGRHGRQFRRAGQRAESPGAARHLGRAVHVEQNWSIKRLIRSIVLSRTYQMSSQFDATADDKDPDNKLLWRHSPRRLDAEEIRDAMLAASGQLKLERPAGSEMLEVSNKPGRRRKAGRGQRRAEHLSAHPAKPVTPETLKVFDMADPNLIQGKRDVTTVPTQALYLLNNPFVLRQAELMARRVLAEDKLDAEARIDLAYRLAIGRLPTPDELIHGRALFAGVSSGARQRRREIDLALAAWSSFCQTLFALGRISLRLLIDDRSTALERRC